jgi:hypothetical protein
MEREWRWRWIEVGWDGERLDGVEYGVEFG